MTALDIIEIGRDLVEVKRIVGHGHFLKWIDAGFGMSRQSADRFIQAADAFPESKSLTVSTLPPTVLYALAAPSTSDEVRTEIVDRAERGEKVVAANVKELKAETRGEEHVEAVRTWLSSGYYSHRACRLCAGDDPS